MCVGGDTHMCVLGGGGGCGISTCVCVLGGGVG